MSISTPFAKPCSFENENDVVENNVAENHMTVWVAGWQQELWGGGKVSKQGISILFGG